MEKCSRVSLKHDGPTGRLTGGRNGVRRANRPRTRVAGVWPVGQDDGPPDFILHVLSRGVINVHYCTYCTSEQTPGQPMATATHDLVTIASVYICVCAYKTSGDDGRYGRRPSLSSTSTSWCRRCRLCLVTTPRRRRHQRVIVRLL